MSAGTTALLRSIRRWLMAVAFAMGVGIVALAETGYAAADYGSGLVFAVTGVTGGVVAVVAALQWLSSFASKPDAVRDE